MQECFTIGISSRALFDLEVENAIFENQGVEAYVDYQIAHEKDVLAPGAAFALIQSFLALNQHSRERQVPIRCRDCNEVGARKAARRSERSVVELLRTQQGAPFPYIGPGQRLGTLVFQRKALDFAACRPAFFGKGLAQPACA